ncbi:hypothetical protein G647_04969 [Cladophialophora carrionii CBS 160.54]|uniref:PWI domain-containing protein n=1 Tax=Cladophialophora carrionii CBS 160.54 TaxID=1279043 RepID=V9DB19_9EURO|nr:uncharacterized protein G647_04969 [Cladophialophora carrionii CBS 160.54]ETI23172.1 hypothetical protein G647_04969 [Cladophialophora carrionii CBS 160.54]
MATAVDQKLLRQTKFPPEFNQKVDMKKVNIEVMKRWIAGKISEILGSEDDVVIELCFNLLEGSRFPDIKALQISLTGFLDRDTPKFCKELWNLCLSAQSNPQGVPKELLEAKKLELMQEKIDAEKAASEAKNRKDQEQAREVDLDAIRQRERAERGTRDLRLADDLPSEVLPRVGTSIPTFLVVAAEEGETLAEAEIVLPLGHHLVPYLGRRPYHERVVLPDLSRGPDLGPRRQLPYEALRQSRGDGRAQEVGAGPSLLHQRSQGGQGGLLNHRVIDAQDLQRVLMYHAHAHLEDDEIEAVPSLAIVEARAPSDAAIGEVIHIHRHGQGQDRKTHEETTEGVTDVATDLPHITLPMATAATSALIFSGVAMHTTTAV